MDALVIRCAILAAAVGSMGASYRTPNFVVEAPSQQMAEQIGQAAEKYRSELAVDWLGKEMRNWAQPCMLKAHVADHLGAGGATSFVFEHGEVFGWRMTIQGSLERILDSVLPHEVTHTIFATHFRQPLPRWADEGACTTVEHHSERAKQQRMLIEFLHTNRGIAFSRMFAMREYPRDVMPLYSQGYSLARFLIAQGGKQKFLNYIADGLRDENWPRATKDHYEFDNLLALQTGWLNWVKQGSPEISTPQQTPALVAVTPPPSNKRSPRPDGNLVGRSQNPGPSDVAAAPGPSAEGASVYDVASNSPSSQNKSWQPKGQAAVTELASVDPPAESAAPTTPATDPSYQVTRPQEIQRPRQVILEWSRPHGADASTMAARPLPGPQ